MDAVLSQVAARFAVSPGDTSPEALARLVAQLHARVGYDSSAKLLWHAAGRVGDPPGLDPARYWEAWLADGSSGTCFATTLALARLFEFLGFGSRMCGWKATAGLTGDVAAVGVSHGANLVTAGDGSVWLVETSTPVYHPCAVPPPGGASRTPDGRLVVHHTDRLRMVLQRVVQTGLKEYELVVDPLDEPAARVAYLEAVTLRSPAASSELLLSRTLPGGRIVVVADDRVSVFAAGQRVSSVADRDPADMARTLELLGFSARYAARVVEAMGA